MKCSSLRVDAPEKSLDQLIEEELLLASVPGSTAVLVKRKQKAA